MRAGVGLNWYKTCLACIKPWVPLSLPYKPDIEVHNPGEVKAEIRFKVIFNYIY